MAKIKFRRDTAANWTLANPTLAQGEPGFEHDTGKLKIGDGTTTWQQLDYNNGDNLSSDREVKVTVGNSQYFAIVNRTNANGENGVDATGVAYDSENNILTLHVSEVYDENLGEYYDRLIISKNSTTGQSIWQKQFQEDVDVDTTHDLCIDADDNIYVAISVDNGEGEDTIVVVKMDSDGAVIWQKDYYGGVDSFLEVGAMVLSGSNLFVAGYYNTNTESEDDESYVMKLSAANGDLVWARQIDINVDLGFSRLFGIDAGADGDIVVVGTCEAPGDGALIPSAYVIKIDSDTGNNIWSGIFFDSDNGQVEYSGGDIVVDSQNNIFVAVNVGTSMVHNDNNQLSTTISYITKLNSSGERQWSRRIGPGPCTSVGTGIDCDDQGNVYLSALTVAQKNPNRENENYNPNDAKNVLALAKYNSAGVVLWQRYIESESYLFWASGGETNVSPGVFNTSLNRGRNLSLGGDGRLAVQIAIEKKDADDNAWDSTYTESVTIQIDQDGREMTIGSGSEKFTVRESRIPGKFITPQYIVQTDEEDPLLSTTVTNSLTVSVSTLTPADGELAQQISQSAPYEYVFGNDGTFTIPNDGDLKLVQTQLGWFSIFGPIKNDYDNVDIRASVVDPSDGSLYAVGESDDWNQGFLIRYNSQGELLWSIRFYDNENANNNRANAVKIRPDTGNIAVLLEYYGSYDYIAIAEVDPDTAQIVNSFGLRDLGDSGDSIAYDFSFTTGTSTLTNVVIVGRKYDEYREQPVSAITGTTTSTLVISANELPGQEITNSWYINGGNYGSRVNINRINQYSSLTGTTNGTGTDAVFTIYATASNTPTYESYFQYTIDTTGTNYQVNDTITVLGTDLSGATPDNDLIITVAAVGGSGDITSITFTGTNQTSTIRLSVAEAVEFASTGGWILEYNLDGEGFIWSENFQAVLSAGGAGNNERYLSVALDSDDNIYAVGEMYATNNAAGGDLNSYWCAVVTKYSSTGSHQWTKALNVTLSDCYAKGVSVQGNTLAVVHEDNYNYTVLTKMDLDGNIKWQRQTNSNDDSSVAVDTNGDIYVVCEANFENKFSDVIKVIKFNSSGEIVWRKFIGTLTYDDVFIPSMRFKNGRNLTLDSDHLYISGYTHSQYDSYRNGVVIKIPKSGDTDGFYGNWALQQENYDVDKVDSTEAVIFTPVISTGDFETWTPDFQSNWFDPSDNDYYTTNWEIKDRDGGAIEFADGSRQTRSAQYIPQTKISNSMDYRLSLEDMGGHLYITNSNFTPSVIVPYHQDNPLPIGYTVVIVNYSGSSINIDADGGGMDIVVPGVDTGQYWDLDSPGMATLIKVENDTWFMTGNVTLD